MPFFPPGTSPGRHSGRWPVSRSMPASFLAVLVALRGIVVRRSTSCRGTTEAERGTASATCASVPRWGALVFLTLLLCMFGWPLVTLLPGIHATQLGRSEQTYSLLVSALATALVAACHRDVRHRGAARLLPGVGAVVGIARASRRVRRSMRPAFAALACAASGFGLILYLSTGQSTLQLAVPDDRRGRVLALGP